MFRKTNAFLVYAVTILLAVCMFVACSKPKTDKSTIGKPAKELQDEQKNSREKNDSSEKKSSGISWIDEEPEAIKEIPLQEIKEVNPEVEKLGRVLSSMSKRAKNAIPNGSPDEFLKDLHKVLDAGKKAEANGLSLYYLIDKKHFAPEGYVPENLVPLVKNEYYTLRKDNLSLRPDVEKQLVILSKAALKNNIRLSVSSTYRSYEYQKNLFDYWVKIDGLEEAERESARPGTSQHQLGTAIDFGTVNDDFAETEMGRWLEKNAASYGWSLSFPKDYEDVTGYRWECWHYRYIGVEACEFQKKWFGNVQQFMIEFIDAWNKAE